MVDFTLFDEGSIMMLRPNSEAARGWAHTNIGPDNGFQPMWPTVVIERRYAIDIVNGIVSDGLTVAS